MERKSKIVWNKPDDDTLGRPKSLPATESIDKVQEAREKMAKMPEGVMTKRLLGHFAPVSTIETILSEGILSPAEQKRQYGRVAKGVDPALQRILCAWDYISVLDPWTGYGTNPQVIANLKKALPQISAKLRPYAASTLPRYEDTKALIAYIDNNFVHFQGNALEWNLARLTGNTKNLRIETTFEHAVDPQYRDVVAEVNQIFEEAAMYVGDLPDYSKDYLPVSEYGTKAFPPHLYGKDGEINPAEVFHDFKTMLLIDPAKERFAGPSAWPAPESLVKNKISPKDIVGIIMADPHPNSKDHPKFRLPDNYEKHILNLAQKSGTPLYRWKEEVRNWKQRAQASDLELIWPKNDGSSSIS